MTAGVDQGRRLEQHIASYFARHGYTTRSNEIIEGRSGGRHEIDVLAEKTDALTTFTVAIECKAWQQPIEKDVVSKLHYVVSDLGLNKGIVVSLGGCRSGAAQAAQELGIELWGTDDLRGHLGESTVNELAVPSEVQSSLTAWGTPFQTTRGKAEEVIQATGKGRMGLRTLEPMTWFSPIWLPAYAVRVTVSQPVTKRKKTRLRTATMTNVYETLSGEFLGRAPERWQEIRLDDRLALRAQVRDTNVHKDLRKTFADYQRVSTPAAVDRHRAKLQALGIPAPCSSLSIDDTGLVYLPLYVGVLGESGGTRVGAVDGATGQWSERLSSVLTANYAYLRSHFAR